MFILNQESINNPIHISFTTVKEINTFIQQG